MHGNHIMYAKERSDCLARLCCAPRHSLWVEFKLTPSVAHGAVMSINIDELPVAMTMEREGCFGKPCLCCCACGDSCKDGMYLHAGAVRGSGRETLTAGALKQGAPSCVGYATQPHLGGRLTPTLNIMERARDDGGWNALAKVEGPTVFGGCAELCCSHPFSVSAMRPEQLHEPIKAPTSSPASIARITKRRPRSLGGMLRELATDADAYTGVVAALSQN